MIVDDSDVQKKGNKEISNGSAMASNGDADKKVNAAANNASIDTLFLINNVNDHATIQHQSSSDQHSEL